MTKAQTKTKTPPRPPARKESVSRTQIERIEVTRQRIIAAALACVDQQGFRNTTLQRVAKEAGVSVGALQYHFPSRVALMEGVLLDEFQNSNFKFKKIVSPNTSLAERISLVVDFCWEHCNSTFYQASLQIQLGMRNESSADYQHFLQAAIHQPMKKACELWINTFSDIPLSEDEHMDILCFLFSTLTGIAQLIRITGEQHRVKNDLERLKKLLLHELKSFKK